MINTFEDFFKLALKRDPGRFMNEQPGPTLNLGAGFSPMRGATNLDLPDWQAPILPLDTETIQNVHAYHFLEHLDPSTAITMLREIERVLKFGGRAWLAMPLAPTALSVADLTHKSFWTEETLRHLFTNKGYDPAGTWQFEIEFCIIAGVAARNLMVFYVLRKQRIVP